jgi:hypothetical protein
MRWTLSGATFLVLTVALAWPGRVLGERSQGIKLTDTGDRIRVEIDGSLFTEYRYRNVSRPLLYPVIGPTGVGVTRHWPMEEAAGEDHDHPHHRSIWFSHGDINGCDFWSEVPSAGKTVHEKFLEVAPGTESGIIRSENKLVTKDGTVIGTELQTLRFYDLKKNRLFDFDVTFLADHGDLTFGDTKEGSLGIRVAESMKLGTRGHPGAGHIVLATGQRDAAAWGKRAPWCDYYGPIDGKIIGIAMFDNPANPRFPTWWHVRDYGLFAANPFGLHEFEKKPVGAGKLIVRAGETITFRHRIYIHEGNEREGDVAGRYEDYIHSR